MSARAVVLFIVTSCCVAGIAHATTVYKSVDADGNVTYSMTPPREAVRSKRMEVHAGQPAADAEARLASARDALAASAESTRSRNKALREARAAKATAEQQLAAARVIEDDDWHGTVGPYRRLKPSYYDRVRRAEAAVALAEMAVHRRCEGSDCEQPTWHIDASTDTVFRPTGSIRHGEASQVVVDTDRRTARSSDEGRRIAPAGSRQEVQGAHARREVWNAKGRTTVQAQTRREVQ